MLYHISAYLGTSVSLFKNQNAEVNGEQEKEAIICVRMGYGIEYKNLS